MHVNNLLEVTQLEINSTENVGDPYEETLLMIDKSTPGTNMKTNDVLRKNVQQNIDVSL